MKLIHSRSSSLPRFSSHLRVLASIFSPKSPAPNSPESLCSRVQIVRDPGASVIPVLDQWIKEGRPAPRNHLRSLIHLMKELKRFNHALEISRWMTDCRNYSLTPSDVAVQLDLISRVQGVEHAENYFNNIPDNSKELNIYGALLGSYLREKSVEKAELIMQQMRERGLAVTSFPYNMMIKLYAQTANHDKIENLMSEMEKAGVPLDIYTLRSRMSTCVMASDILGMEKILKQMEEFPFGVDWNTCALVANGYLKVGSIEEAFEMLRKAEEKLPAERKTLALDYLLSLYARTGDKGELYRVWNQYKASFVRDSSYACMISSLANLDDLEGAEEVFHEWESQCKVCSFCVLNRLLSAYCRKGLPEKAESVLMRVSEGRTPYASSWNILGMGYMDAKQMGKAVEMVKKTMLVGRQSWRINSVLLETCLEYLEGKGDLEEMEQFIGLTKNSNPLTRDMYHRLLRMYITSGRSVDGIVAQMESDGFEVEEETRMILETAPSS